MPRQGIMLCYPFDLNRFKKWGEKALLQPKYNGDRMRAIFNSEGKVTLLSSEMHQVSSLPHLVNRLQSLHLKNLELDGEAYTHHMNHELIHGIFSRTTNLHPSYEELGFTIFDLVSPQPIEERLKKLDHLLQGRPRGVYIAPTFWISSLEEMEKHLNYLYDKGYEGIVIKQEGSLYERKRSTQWMKLKPREADVYEIVGVKEEVDIKGKAKNTLGSFICRTPGEETFRVGSGPLLTRDARQVLWFIKEELPGHWLQVKYCFLTADREVPHPAVAFAVLTKEEAEEWKGKEECE